MGCFFNFHRGIQSTSENILAQFGGILLNGASETDNLRKTGKNHRFLHGKIFKFFLPVEPTLETFLANFHRNPLIGALETDISLKNRLK